MASKEEGGRVASWRGPWGIAHRGASAELPEHTREAYKLAVAQGAHFIECDVVLTRDLVPICRHEPNLSNTTDALKKFPNRVRTYSIDGENVTGVFSVDLTAAEVATLTALQPWPFRDQSHCGLKVATLADYLHVARSANRSVGIYPETKHPTWTNSLPILQRSNTTLEDILLDALAEAGFNASIWSLRWRQRPVFLQSFEAGSLRYMATRTCAPLILLTGDADGWVAPDSGMSLAELTSDASLREVATWAAGLGPAKTTLVRWTEEQQAELAGGAPALRARYVSTGLVERAHAHGLQVHTYTLRPEARFFLPHLAEHANVSAAAVNITAEYELFVREVGIDALFTDQIASFRQWQQLAAGGPGPRWAGRKALLRGGVGPGRGISARFVGGKVYVLERAAGQRPGNAQGAKARGGSSGRATDADDGSVGEGRALVEVAKPVALKRGGKARREGGGAGAMSAGGSSGSSGSSRRATVARPSICSADWV